MNNILEIRDILDNNKITKEELFKECYDKAINKQDYYNAFVTILDEPSFNEGTSLLKDIPYALKDNISTKGILTTASSNLLSNYVPVYDATIYKKLEESGAVLLGKTCLDELAMGGTGTTGHTGVQKNPWDTSRICGGSSSGSVAAVASGIVPFAIGSDTGDSVRKPAAFCGVVGFKPTYGRISRYGLFAFASSLDHLGVIARNVTDVAIVTDVIKGYDEKDMTSLPNDDKCYYELLNKDIKDKKLFYIKEIVDKSMYENLDSELESIIDNFNNLINRLKTMGVTVVEESFDKNLLSAINPTYHTISSAEATSNNSNLTGIPFGNRIDGNTPVELMFNTRTKGFSELIKRRFVLGSYVLQKENQEKLYLNACRLRNMIVTKMNDLFTKYDALILPSAEGIAPKFDNSTDDLDDKHLVAGNHLCIGNFGGYPSISIPCGFVNNMPIGVSITGPAFKDDVVLNIAKKIEDELDYKDMIAGDRIC